MTQNLNPKIRKADLLDVALRLARKHGYAKITRAQIAELANLAEGTVSYHFGTMNKLRVEVMRYAVKQNDPIVVMQGLAVKDRHAAHASPELRAAALATIA